MKKCIVLALSLCLVLSVLAPAAVANAGDAQKLRVVTTIFPPYDFARNIAGDAIELSMLLSPGAESHSFEPSPRDIITIQNADVFVYIGGEADAWVDRILESMDTQDMTILALSEMVDTVDEEIVEGMEHSHDHDHGEAGAGAIYDRPLTDWHGEWMSIYPLFAQDDPEGAAKWESDIDTMSIETDTLRLATADGSHEGVYEYAGYSAVESDHGISVWYQFTLAQPVEGMPTNIAFNDHGTGTDGHDHDEHAEEAHDHDHGEEIAHFHMRYGEEGFETLTSIEGWSPTFFPAGTAKAQVEETLSAHNHSHDEEEHEHAEMDEHVWTSPRNAKAIVDQMADALIALDAANADAYRANADAYMVELDALDQAFVEATTGTARDTIVFGDRFPFRYLADAYGLSYFAAFPGCATETEASATTIAFLIDKVREEQIPAIFTIEFSNGRIADVIAESTEAVKLEMHSCHNVSKKDFDSGVGYLELMYRNVDALKEALN